MSMACELRCMGVDPRRDMPPRRRGGGARARWTLSPEGSSEVSIGVESSTIEISGSTLEKRNESGSYLTWDRCYDF
jgi:hypothetical protein